MEKQKSRRAVERLAIRIKEFINITGHFPNERLLEIYSNTDGIPEDILEVFQDIHVEQNSIEQALADRIGEEFIATPLEMLELCDEVIHFGLATGGFSFMLCAFLADQLFKLDVAPYNTSEAGMNFIQTKLDEADPQGRWTVSACTCERCLATNSPGIRIETAFAEEHANAVLLATEIAMRNNKNLRKGRRGKNSKNGQEVVREAPWIKNMITGADLLDVPEKIQ